MLTRGRARCVSGSDVDTDVKDRAFGRTLSAPFDDLGRRAEAFCLLRISDPNYATSVVVLISKAEPVYICYVAIA